VDLTRMPFDTQKCQWIMGLYTDKAEDVSLMWKPDRDAIRNWRNKCPISWVVTALHQENRVESWPSGNYSYAFAELEFTRKSADSMMRTYFISSMTLVALSYLGMFINPAATPARVALGIITILTVLNLSSALRGTVPEGYKLQEIWLFEFLTVSFYFNVAIFVEQVMVNFAIQAHVWVIDYDKKAKQDDDPAHDAQDPQAMSMELEEKDEDVEQNASGGVQSAQRMMNVQNGVPDAHDADVPDRSAPELPAGAPTVIPTWAQVRTRPSNGKLISAKSRALARGLSSASLHSRQALSSTKKSLKASVDLNNDGKISCYELLLGWSSIKKALLKYPLLKFVAGFRFADHYGRVLVPVSYLSFVGYMLSKSQAGEYYEKVFSSQCN